MPGSTATTAYRVAAKRVMIRLGAWLGVAILLLQMVVPLSAPQAAWVEDGLFPPTCSAHQSEPSSLPADLSDCTQCPLCQVSASQRLLPLSLRVAAVAYEPAARAVRHAEPLTSIPGGGVTTPPLPSRGPPPAA